MRKTLNQAERHFYDYGEKEVEQFIIDINSISNHTDLSIDQILKVCEILELRRKNEQYKENGDHFDIQMEFFATMTDRFIEHFIKAFGTDSEKHPRFLEGIAMALGIKSSISIAEALQDLKSE